MTTLKLHLIVLPRWFGLPAALAAVALGAVLAGAAWWLMLLALASGAFMMAWAHVMNTYLDHEWTGFERGDVSDRSRPKAYTTGQQPIAAGLAKPAQVLGSALVWLLLSAPAAVPISGDVPGAAGAPRRGARRRRARTLSSRLHDARRLGAHGRLDGVSGRWACGGWLKGP